MTIQEINKKLEDYYGKDLYGNPKFRLSWSNFQVEKRKGTFNEFSGDLFVRQTTGVKEVKKYPYIDSRWVLEIISPNPYDDVDTKLSYEPLWVFQNAHGDYVEPIWRAVNFVITCYLNPQKLTPGQIESEDEREFAKEVLYFENLLAGESSWVSNALITGEGVVVPENKPLIRSLENARNASVSDPV